MGIQTTQHVLFDDVILFLRKHLQDESVSERRDTFFEVLGYDDPETALKDFVFDYVWKFPNDKQLIKLENAIEYLIADIFANFIIHCSPNENKYYAPMSNWDYKMKEG